MTRDTVVEETRRIRDRLAEAHGYDLRKIARALQEEETKSGRKPVTTCQEAPASACEAWLSFPRELLSTSRRS